MAVDDSEESRSFLDSSVSYADSPVLDSEKNSIPDRISLTSPGDSNKQPPNNCLQNGGLPSQSDSIHSNSRFNGTSKRPEISSSLQYLPDAPRNSQKNPEPVFTPPDGGYGWVVVAAAFVAQIWIVGFIKSYSIIYIGIRAKFPESSAYHTSWIQGMMITIGLVLSPLCGYLTKRYSARLVSTTGGLLCFTGIFLGAFATSINQLIFTVGIVNGMGLGFITTTGILIVNMYFDKKRSLASGICISGNCIGAFVLTPLIQVLMDRYGLEGTLLICAAMQLQLVPAAMLFTPPSEYAKREAKKLKNRTRMCVPPEIIEEGLIGRDARLEMSTGLKHQKLHATSKGCHRSSHHVDNDMLEISMYKCVPITSSVPNLRDFSYAPCRSHADISSYGDTLTVPTRADYDYLSNKNIKSVINSDIRVRSVSESQYKEDTTKTHQNASNNAPRPFHKEISLRKELSQRINATNFSSKDQKDEVDETTPENKLLEPNLTNELKPSTLHNSSEEQSQRKCSPARRPNAIITAITSIFEPRVLCKPYMVVCSLCLFFYSLGLPHALFFVHAHFTWLDPMLVATVLSVASLADLTARLGVGYIADTGLVPLTVLVVFCISTAGLSVLSVPLVTSAWGAAVALSATSFGLGGFAVMLPVMLARDLGAANLPVAYGFSRMLMGFMNFTSPQITGVLIDQTGAYAAAYYFMGACVCGGAVVLLVGRLVVEARSRATNGATGSARMSH